MLKYRPFDIIAAVVLALIAMVFLSLIFSCSPQKRFNRLVKKHPELLKKDTVKVSDTTIIKETATDTVFKLNRDTTIIKRDRLVIKHFYKDSLVYLEGRCETDTIIKIINVPVKVPVITRELTMVERIKADLKRGVTWFVIALCFLSVVGLLLFMKR